MKGLVMHQDGVRVLRHSWLALALLLGLTARTLAADSVYTVTYLEVNPTAAASLGAIAQQYARTSRGESGNESAAVYQEIGRASRLVLLEQWRDAEALAAHEKAGPTAVFRDRLRSVHRAPYDQRVNHGFAIDPQPQMAKAGSVYVVTHVDVPGAFREKAEVLLRELAEASRAVAGHVRYDVYQQVDPRMNHFSVYAVWDSLSAVEDYGGSAGARRFRAALAPMLGALYDERLYKPVAGERAR